MDKLHDAPLPRRGVGRKRRVKSGAVTLLVLLVLATAWWLRTSDTGGRSGSDDEPSNLELHKMQLEGGTRYRSYLRSHPGDHDRLHHLDEPETAHHRQGGWLEGMMHTTHQTTEPQPDDSADITHQPRRDSRQSSPSNSKGGDLIADVNEPDVPDEPDVPEIDQTLYDFEILPPPTIDASLKNYQQVDPSKTEHPRWMREMWSQTTTSVTVTGSELEVLSDTIPPELAHVKPGETLFVTFGTISVKDFVVNWLRSAEALRLAPLFVGALDDEMYRYCVANKIPSMLLKGNSVLKNRKSEFITAGDASFKKMGTVKTKFVQDLLEMGIAPILTDADVTWLKDPRAYFKKGTYAIADALVSTDCIDVPGDKHDENECSHVNFNTGVLHFRPTVASKKFVEAWKTKVATSTIAWMRDQPAFNLLTHEGVGGHSLSPAVSIKKEKKGQEGHRMVYYAANATLKLGVLPNWLFGSGHTYFVQAHHETHPTDGSPFSVHLTYQYGDTGNYAFGKRERMRQGGLWRADVPGYFGDLGAGDGDTNTNWDTGGVDTGGTAAVWDKNHVGGEKFLVVLDSGAQLCFPGEYSIGTDAGAYKVAIQRHFAEDKLRRVTVRNAMALAEALGRTLVLPKARCYCDKIWNNLNACRAPGSETFTLPYQCPMDHIYDLPAWFTGGKDGEAKRPFRTAGFLTDDRLGDLLKERQSTVRLVVDRRAYESVARKNNAPVAGSPTDSVNGKRAWTSDELRSATVLEPGFTTGELIAALKATPWNHTQTATDAPILEFDFLGGDGSFCGFGDGDDGGRKNKSAAERNREFDTSTAIALSGDQYYCFTESWRDMGSPKSGGDEPYEPQVVKRHCGEMEPEFRARGNVHPGTVEHILKPNPTCSCEWGFGAPRPLAEIANDPNVCRKRGGEPGTREV